MDIWKIRFEEAIWVGLENYRWLLFNENTALWNSVRITVIYVVVCLVIELVFGFVHRPDPQRKEYLARSIYTAILIIPIVVMPSMVGMVFRLYFSYDGLVNYFIETVFGTKLELVWSGARPSCGHACRYLAIYPFLCVNLAGGVAGFTQRSLRSRESRRGYELAVISIRYLAYDGTSRCHGFNAALDGVVTWILM